MSTNSKLLWNAIAGLLLICSSAAIAELEYGSDWTGFDPKPDASTHICLGSSCLQHGLYGAAQSADCDKSGTGSFGQFRLLEDEYGSLRRMENPPRRNNTGLDLRLGDSLGYPNFEWRIAPRGDSQYGLPGTGSIPSLDDYRLNPLRGFNGAGSSIPLDRSTLDSALPYFPEPALGGFQLPTREFGSLNFATPASGVPDSLQGYLGQQFDVGGVSYSSLMFDADQRGAAINALADAGISNFENNWCRRVLIPRDPHFAKDGRHGGNSWGEAHDDQWAIKRVGFSTDETSAWNMLPASPAQVVVAVIDSGLDWHHPDIDPRNVWRNTGEVDGNGIDDDNNGYVDDIIGWNFVEGDNRPWDNDGHGTVVTGIIAASQDNNEGIAGINPHARIMVLKAVNNFGTSRASYIAEAIAYAVDNGARVVNISVGGPHSSAIEQAAIAYAHEQGVLVVAAAGNDGVELADFGPGGHDAVLTVGATFMDDRAAGFSNYGDKVDLVAPGVDVLSLRARFTDANYRPGESSEYALGQNYVGENQRYLRASGTSFSTPIVAAVASLLMSKDPQLSAADVRERLLMTAEDLEAPGKDRYTGFGLVDARTALSVDSTFALTAKIDQVEFVDSETFAGFYVRGTIDADRFKRAWVQLGAGQNPGTWTYVGQKQKYPIHNGVLSKIKLSEFEGNDIWQVVVNVEHRNGVVRSDTYLMKIR